MSAYDYFLSQLLKIVLQNKPELIFTSEKSIKFSDLAKYESIEEARNAIISKEIETVLRSSHSDHFDWMEERFGLSLRSDLHVWPKFVEVCERRNLFTHTGGIVTQQYLNVCKLNKCSIADVLLSDRLDVDPEYFKDAVRAFYEVGAKLSYVLWRKFARQEAEKADEVINNICLNLISRGSYQLAEAILTFTSFVMKKSRGSELLRRMMIVNLANAKALQNKLPEAEKVLVQEDWSASGANFQICIASIRGDIDETIKWMKIIGADGSPNVHSYRAWPCFRKISEDTFSRGIPGGIR